MVSQEERCLGHIPYLPVVDRLGVAVIALNAPRKVATVVRACVLHVCAVSGLPPWRLALPSGALKVNPNSGKVFGDKVRSGTLKVNPQCEGYG